MRVHVVLHQTRGTERFVAFQRDECGGDTARVCCLPAEICDPRRERIARFQMPPLTKLPSRYRLNEFRVRGNMLNLHQQSSFHLLTDRPIEPQRCKGCKAVVSPTTRRVRGAVALLRFSWFLFHLCIFKQSDVGYHV
jgi:hypothetical protein